MVKMTVFALLIAHPIYAGQQDINLINGEPRILIHAANAVKTKSPEAAHLLFEIAEKRAALSGRSGELSYLRGLLEANIETSMVIYRLQNHPWPKMQRVLAEFLKHEMPNASLPFYIKAAQGGDLIAQKRITERLDTKTIDLLIEAGDED